MCIRDRLYVEVHEALEEQRDVHVPEADVADAIHLARRLSSTPVAIDWSGAKAAAVRKSGMPVRVSGEDSASIASSP